MPSERRRHQFYEEAKKVFSPDSADELMSYLPPVGWADVATKADLGLIRNEMDALRAELRGEMAELRGEMGGLRGEMDGLRGEMDALRSELRGEMAGLQGEMGGLRGEMDALRSELRGEMTALRSEIQTEMAKGFVSTQRWLIATMIAFAGMLAAAVLAGGQLHG